MLSKAVVRVDKDGISAGEVARRWDCWERAIGRFHDVIQRALSL